MMVDISVVPVKRIPLVKAFALFFQIVPLTAEVFVYYSSRQGPLLVHFALNLEPGWAATRAHGTVE